VLWRAREQTEKDRITYLSNDPPYWSRFHFHNIKTFFFGSFICHFQPYILSRYSFPNFTFNPQRREQPRLRIASLRNYIFLRHPIILKMTTYRPWSINNAKSMKQLAKIIVAVTLLASRKARRAVSLTANIYLQLVMPITAIMVSPGCKMPHQHCSLSLKVGIKLPDFNMSLRSHYLVQLLSFSCLFPFWTLLYCTTSRVSSSMQLLCQGSEG